MDQRPARRPRSAGLAPAALLVALMVLVGAGCGGGPTRPAASPTPAPLPSGALGEADDRGTVSVPVGAVVHVALHAPAGWANWSHPRSSDPSVLAPTVDTAATATIGTTLAAFRALRPGVARLESTTVPLCSPGLACPAIARIWTVTVSIG